MSNAHVDRALPLLEFLRESLNADGYDLGVQPTNNGLRVNVSATSAACEDCLVPKPIFGQIIRTALAADPFFDGLHIDLHYPADGGDTDASSEQGDR